MTTIDEIAARAAADLRMDVRAVVDPADGLHRIRTGQHRAPVRMRPRIPRRTWALVSSAAIIVAGLVGVAVVSSRDVDNAPATTVQTTNPPESAPSTAPSSDPAPSSTVADTTAAPSTSAAPVSPLFMPVEIPAEPLDQATIEQRQRNSSIDGTNPTAAMAELGLDRYGVPIIYPANGYLMSVDTSYDPDHGFEALGYGDGGGPPVAVAPGVDYTIRFLVGGTNRDAIETAMLDAIRGTGAFDQGVDELGEPSSVLFDGTLEYSVTVSSSFLEPELSGRSTVEVRMAVEVATPPTAPIIAGLPTASELTALLATAAGSEPDGWRVAKGVSEFDERLDTSEITFPDDTALEFSAAAEVVCQRTGTVVVDPGPPYNICDEPDRGLRFTISESPSGESKVGSIGASPMPAQLALPTPAKDEVQSWLGGNTFASSDAVIDAVLTYLRRPDKCDVAPAAEVTDRVGLGPETVTIDYRFGCDDATGGLQLTLSVGSSADGTWGVLDATRRQLCLRGVSGGDCV
jgi:hypothetical protein